MACACPLALGRDTNGNKIDLLWERQRTLIPMEIKSAMTWNNDFPRAIRRFRKSVPASEPVACRGQGVRSCQSRDLFVFSTFTGNWIVPPSVSGEDWQNAVNILFIGDIVGAPGRRAVKQLVPGLRARHDVSVVIANGENAAGGSGITPETAAEIYSSGVDLITTGDHLWDQKEVEVLLDGETRFLRPLNYPHGTPGQGSTVLELAGHAPLGVINLQGRTFMAALENPFAVIQPEIDRLRPITPLIFVDFHAEATSEKIAMGRMLDGKVSAVVGTHTHVPTADEQIFPGGTGFLCDVGFTGAQESVLGREIDPVIRRFVTMRPQRFAVAKRRIRLQAILLKLDEETGHTVQLERIAAELPADPGASTDPGDRR